MKLSQNSEKYFMFIPLGFGKKVPGLTPISYLLLIVITIFSVQGFKDFKQIQKLNLQSSEHAAYEKSLIDLISIDCPKHLKQKQCLYLQTEAIKAISPDETVDKAAKEKKKRHGLTITELLEVKKYFQNLLSKEQKEQSPEHQKFWELRQQSLATYADKMGEHGVLVSHQKNWISALKSNFLHADWLHLIGNLLILWFFSRLIEARLGAYLTLLLFLVGGTAGLWVQAMTSSEPIAILGASAGVCAVVGAFYVSFFQRQVRIFILTPMAWLAHQEIHIPVKWGIPVAYVIADIAGALAADPSGGGVAYLAHLSGFVVGALFALAYEYMISIPPAVLFAEEERLLTEFSSTRKVENLLEVLQMNPDSSIALKKIIRHYLAVKDYQNPHFKSALTQYWAYQFKNRQWTAILKILGEVPPEISFIETFPKLGQKTLLATGQVALKAGDWQTSIRVYGLFAEKFAGPKTSHANYETLKGLVKVGQETETGQQWLRKWYESLRHLGLKDLLSKDFQTLFTGGLGGKHSA